MKHMVIRLLLFLMLCFSCTDIFANEVAVSGQGTVDEAQLQKLQARMMGDPQIMAMITALQNDPELMALLSDPSFLQAISNRDMDKLSADPRFAKLLSNPAIMQILKRVGK